MSYGERAVGLAFDPSGDPQVKRIKVCHDDRLPSGVSPERERLWSIAIKEAQGAQMWAVKAAAWRD